MKNSQIIVKFTLGEDKPFLDIDVSIPCQGVTAVIGDSGSGKTSFLRCIAGLEKAKNGYCSVNGDIWQDNHTFVATHKRDIGYVFQEASLFSHLSARQNLAYGQKRSLYKHKQSFFDKVINVLGVEAALDQYPQQLSGGERQRIAIARAILMQPKLLLMDEPLASLDKSRKQEILPYLERLVIEFKLPILYVTHAIDEVIRLADYIVVLKQGCLEAKGSVSELFSRIDLPFGMSEEVGVVIECKVIEHERNWDLVRFAFDGGVLYATDNQYVLGENLRIRVLSSDISISISRPADLSVLNVFECSVLALSDAQHPAMQLVTLKVGNSRLIASVTKKSVQQLKLCINSRVWALIKSVAIVR
ncbi:molybdenum ABC transporter ATP-binding protein [Paraglaciecola sp. L3A3]|uniref:molybdenum ABC transporter ATP-binding protein n=1 Tax=Paraglaciecola sp. L3A3 TaxID=2686358 RepID=UPI00131ABBC7|nr:molybdenum ABC transporter ATP-binding protein [Paraglaciecola sp. L3A3]